MLRVNCFIKVKDNNVDEVIDNAKKTYRSLT